MQCAAQRFADYENEIRVLQAQLRQQQRRNAETEDRHVEVFAHTGRPSVSRFGSFMRKGPSATPNTTGGAATARVKELEDALAVEQAARSAAEKKVEDVNSEVEELSETLFSQANEMVATERRENAKLRERIDELEMLARGRGDGDGSVDSMEKENVRLWTKMRTLEQRDSERRKRLERLEAAGKRMDRVKTLLVP